MKKIIIFLVLFFSAIDFVSAIEINYSNVLEDESDLKEHVLVGDTDHLYFEDIKLLDDGGFVAVGFQSFLRAYIARYDSQGNKLWSDTDEHYFTQFQSVQVTEDGGFLVTGTYCDAPSRYLAKYDENGVKEWSKVLGTLSDGSQLIKIIPYQDNKYIAIGQINILTDSGNYYIPNIVIFDDDGNIILDKEISDFKGYVSGGILASDNNILLVGNTYGEDKPYLLRLSINGTIIDKKYYSGSGIVYNDIVENDNSFFLVGSQNNHAYASRLDYEGNQLWAKSFYTSNMSKFTKAAYFYGRIIAVGYERVADSTMSNGIIVAITNDGSEVETYVKKTAPTKYTSLEVIDNSKIYFGGIVSPEGFEQDYLVISSRKETSFIDRLDIKYDYELNESNNGYYTFDTRNNMGILNLKPDDGFTADKVVVTDSLGYDVPVSIVDDLYQFYINDDIEVLVSYKEIEAEDEVVINPNTSTFIIGSFVILLSLIVFIIFYYRKKRLE